jgi:hypothetical protein
LNELPRLVAGKDATSGVNDGCPAFQKAVDLFDAENAHDPNIEVADGASHPREWLYARRLTDQVLSLAPDASEALRLAARCQHICRWMIPRSSQPMTRAGYLRWRAELKQFHARKSGEILREAGYSDDMITRVQDLNLKRNFPGDPESRILEDALCLVFLEFQFADLVRKTDDDKIINAVRKTWQKMTPAAHERALLLPFGEKEKSLIALALN